MFALVPDLVFGLVSLRTGEDFWVVQWKLSAVPVMALHRRSLSRAAFSFPHQPSGTGGPPELSNR